MKDSNFLINLFFIFLKNIYTVYPRFWRIERAKIFVSKIGIHLNRGTLKCMNNQRINHLLEILNNFIIKSMHIFSQIICLYSGNWLQYLKIYLNLCFPYLTWSVVNFIRVTKIEVHFTLCVRLKSFPRIEFSPKPGSGVTKIGVT